MNRGGYKGATLTCQMELTCILFLSFQEWSLSEFICICFQPRTSMWSSSEHHEVWYEQVTSIQKQSCSKMVSSAWLSELSEFICICFKPRTSMLSSSEYYEVWDEEVTSIQKQSCSKMVSSAWLSSVAGFDVVLARHYNTIFPQKGS